MLAALEALVEALTDEGFQRASLRAGGGTIGKHVRHTLEHVAAALTPIGAGGGVVAYDQRRRDPVIETSRGAALGAMRELMTDLGAVEPAAEGRAVAVRVMLTAAGAEHEFQSTLGRELAFAAHHALHHHAMIRIIAEELGAELAAEFGKAPATIHHEARCGLPANNCGA